MRAASFLTLKPGTPVVDRFGQPVGKVHRVLVLETGGFDGIVVKTDAGTRFVAAGAVTLGVTVDDVVSPGPNARRIYGMPEARYDRVHVTEADRDEASECLKRRSGGNRPSGGDSRRTRRRCRGCVHFLTARSSHRRPSTRGGSHEVSAADSPGRHADAARP